MANDVLLDDQETDPLVGLPLASLSVAVNCAVEPAATDAVAGATVTDATGAGTPADARLKLHRLIEPVPA